MIIKDKALVNSPIGFSDENYPTNIEYLDKLLVRIRKNIDENKKIFESLSQKNKNIIYKYISGIEKKKINQTLEKDEYFLQGQELLKEKKVSDKDFFRFLIYRYKYSLNSKLHKIEEYPPCVQIEPTSICNFRCVMCYQSDKTFSSKSNGMMGHMSLDLFKKIIDEIEGKVEAVTLASRGEPTLNPRIIDMIEYCKDKFLGLKINTNASLLNEKLTHSLLGAEFNEIVFSIDSADKETFEKIRVNGKFEKVFSNLKIFYEIRKKYYKNSSTIVKISGVKINSELNVKSLEKKLGDFADIVQLVGYTPWESSYDNSPNNLTAPCAQLWLRMFVWWDGKVNPCDYDYKSKLSKWNVNDKSISEIWRSSEYQEYRSKHISQKRKELFPCDRCTFVNV
jgi:radical SAM protein with 4Fe4S-binding SPASM domain